MAAWVTRGAALMSALPVVAYGFLAGMSPPTQRAVIMVMAFLIALLLEREHDKINTLAVAALVILIIDPTALFAISFQLSFAAVFAIIAFLSVPLNFMAIRWWRTIHPVVVGTGSADAQGGFSLGPTIRLVFFFSLFAFTVLYFALMALRTRTEWLAREVEHLKHRIIFR